MKVLENAAQPARIFYCRHMQPGTVGYEKETILLDTDAIKRMVPSGVGIPVYVGHIDGEVDLKTLKERADGFVTESFYNELDGWAWFKFLAIDDKAHEAIKKGWSVSNAHMPIQFNAGGTKNNIPYKREVIDSNYTHLAIVPDPRYEGACIMTPDEFKTYQETNRKKLAELQNSKGIKTMKFFKTKREEVATVDADTEIELSNGKTATLQEMINSLEKPADKKFSVNGEEMTAEEIKASYEAMLNGKKAKKNGSEEETPHGEDEDVDGDQEDEGDDEIGQDKKNKKMKKNKKPMKKNMADCDGMENDAEDGDKEDEKDDKKEKKNSVGTEVEVDDKFFHELRNAHLSAAKRGTTPMVTTSTDGIARGKQRYGSAQK